MNSTNKVVLAYSKSLFQSVYSNSNKLDTTKDNQNIKEQETYKLSLITSFEKQNAPVTINVIREELALIYGFFLTAENSEKIFKNPVYSEDMKANILFQVFPGFSQTMKSFLMILTEKNHLFLLPQIFFEFEKLVAKAQKSVKIKLMIANPLEENFATTFLKILKKITNAKQVILSVIYNPKILGGIVIEYNSIAIDASILKEFSFFFNN
jgi:ATP synthase F1 delta subunit